MTGTDFYFVTIIAHHSNNSQTVQQDATIAFFIRNGFTLHVSGDNLTHHQEYNAVYGHR